MKRFERVTKPLMWSMALLLAALAAGCNNGSGPILGGGGLGTPTPVIDTTAPWIALTGPSNGALSVPQNASITATFSESMKSSTIVSATPSTAAGTTFTVCDAGAAASAGVCGANVAGVVTYVGTTATFKPNAAFTIGKWYRATISAAATDLAGNALIGGTMPNPWIWQAGAADTTPPTIILTNPADAATNVPVNSTINATFSEPMDQATMITANFTVVSSTSVNVAGNVSYDAVNNIATFIPLSALSPGVQYTATVTSGATDLAGNALNTTAAGAPNDPWKFTTAASSGPIVPLAINLRDAASFGIAARAGLTSTGVTVVNGDIALYPLAGCTDSTGNAGASQTCLVKTYSSPTGMSVNGSIYWAGDPYDNGGTANAVTNDLNIAWTEAMNKVDTQAGVLAGELGGTGPVGKTLIPGVYHEAALGLAAGNVATFDAQGNANAIFIIKIDSSFTDSGTLLLPTQLKLANGAQARNIWFATGSAITIGSGTTWNGNILAGGSATVNNGSTVMGRVLAGAAGAGAITLTGAASPSVTTITVPQ